MVKFVGFNLQFTIEDQLSGANLSHDMSWLTSATHDMCNFSNAVELISPD